MSTENNKQYRTKKWIWIGGSVMGLSLVLFLAYIFFNNWLHNKLETMVYQESNGIYKLSMHRLKASPLTGMLSVDSLTLKPDLNTWEKQQQDSVEAPRMLMHLKSGKVELHGLSYWNILLGKSIEMSSLSVLSPEMSITRMRQDTTSRHEPMHEAAQGMLKGLKINEISVQQATISYTHASEQKTETLKVSDLNLHVNNFQLDSASFHAVDKAYYANRIYLEADQTTLRSLNGFYEIKAGPVKVDTDSGYVNISRIKVKPLLEPAEMAEKKGEAVTYAKGELADFNVNGINFTEHSRNNTILVNKVILNQPSLSLYKDKKNFQSRGTKPLPHDIVQQIKTSFLADTVLVQGMYIRYDELAEKATEPGHIYFTNLYSTITNLTNMPGKISRKTPAIVQVKGRFMGEAPLNATVVLPLLDKNGYHTLEAEVGQADPRLLNPILEPTNLMSIKSGQLQKGYAKMEFNKEEAKGTMRVYYQNFKVELLSDSKGNEQSLGKKILSKAANVLAIKSDNPAEGEKLRIGDITATRDPGRSVFTYWKNGLASGFLSSAGLDIIADK